MQSNNHGGEFSTNQLADFFLRGSFRCFNIWIICRSCSECGGVSLQVFWTNVMTAITVWCGTKEWAKISLLRGGLSPLLIEPRSSSLAVRLQLTQQQEPGAVDSKHIWEYENMKKLYSSVILSALSDYDILLITRTLNFPKLFYLLYLYILQEFSTSRPVLWILDWSNTTYP